MTAKMRPEYILILLAMTTYFSPLVSGSVVINEVELDYLEDDEEVQWIELYNSGPIEVDISGWAVMSRDDRSRKEFVPDGTVIPPDGFFLISFSEKWLSNFGTVLVLESDIDRAVDHTTSLYDNQEDSCAWGRYPDGGSEWMFMDSTPGDPNSGVPCDEEESRAIVFDMRGSVSGTGYVNLQNQATGPDGGSVLSHEHGSGDYSSDTSLKMDINNVANTSSIQLRKDFLSMRYNRTALELPGYGTAVHDSKWAESSAITGGQEGFGIESRASQSTTYATSISKEILARSDYGYLKLNLSSDSSGKSNVDYCSEDLKLSEEYLGAFQIEESITEDDYHRAVNTTGESGYVDVYKKVGEDYSTYERGSGSYRAEEMIEADDYAMKDVSLVYLPASFAYLPRLEVNRSHKWDEGFRLNASNGLYAQEAYSSLERMEKEAQVSWPNDVKTSASFTGKARLKAVFRPENNTSTLVVVDDEYLGNYNIERKINILPKYTTPHMSVYKQGYVDPNSCDVLWFTVTVVNDGNRIFSPVYVRDTFPSGTRFMGSSIDPMELTRSYGNWSIPALGSGESFSIQMQFQIITRRENYTNRARANTIYIYSSRGALKERNLRVSNSSTLSLDWSDCSPDLLPLDFTATVSTADERIVNYRLILNNSADYNISANVTVLLPEGMSFINSTTATLENQSGVVKWNIRKIDPGRRRTVSFMTRAERDGLFEVKSHVYGNSTEGNESVSASSTALIVVGKAPQTANVESLQSLQWLPCEDSALSQSLAKLETTSSAKELKCCSW